jgi:hypothetical protein
MNPFWKNVKYQSQNKFPKEIIIEELHRFMKPFDIKLLPSFPSLNWVFKKKNRESILKQIEQKAEKSRKRHWQHNKFDEKLIEKINTLENSEELAYWVGVFLEYYKFKKSESKND